MNVLFYSNEFIHKISELIAQRNNQSAIILHLKRIKKISEMCVLFIYYYN